MMQFTRAKWTFIALLFFPVFHSAAQTKSPEPVLQTELKRFNAMVQKDTVLLERLLAQDLVYVHSNALKENKQEHIRSIITGKIVYQRMDREEATVRLYGKTAVINGAIKVKGILSANPFEVRMLYTAVYRKNKAVWQ